MLGIDRSIAIIIANRVWGVMAGPATLIFIANYLAPMEQGFYYGFTSLLGLQVFFELGLGFVVMQTASHLMAHLRIDNSEILGDVADKARLGRLFSDILIWYSIVCVAFIISAWLAGGWFFSRTPSSSSVDWELAWTLVVPIFGLSILANAAFSLLEGMGQVADVAAVRLVQSVSGMLCLWLMLYLGFNLMALVALHLSNLMLALVWLFYSKGRLLHNLFSKRAKPGTIDWGTEIWPFQWRIALSWIAGYVGTQAITLILFSYLGPIEAGKFGFSLMAMGAIASSATAWVTTKSSMFGGLVVKRQFDELEFIYVQARRGALIVGSLGVSVMLACVGILVFLDNPFVDRFVPISGLCAMAIAMLVNVKVSCDATYLRAFRREPYLFLSIIIGLTQISAAIYLAKYNSLISIIFSYAIIYIGFGMIWSYLKFNKLCETYKIN